MIIERTARAVGIFDVCIVSTTKCTHFTLNLLFICPWHCFQFLAIKKETCFYIIFLFHKCNVISIDNVKNKKKAATDIQPNRRCLWYLKKVKVSGRNKRSGSMYHSKLLKSLVEIKLHNFKPNKCAHFL